MKALSYEITEDLENLIESAIDERDTEDAAEYEKEIEFNYKKDKFFLKVSFRYVQKGYDEDEHDSGTGAFVQTGIHFVINSVELWDEEGDPLAVEYDEGKIEEYVETI
jgi:hypothetical protein